MKKILVVGSGISGLSISRILADRYEVEIVEKAKKVGGLIKCERINGNLFHLVGGHVFNSKNKAVLNWFWSHFDRDLEFVETKRNAKILMNGNFIGYPIENYIYQLPEEQCRKIVKELLQKQKEDSSDFVSSQNFKEFLIGNFGEELYNIYFGPYNSKLWNTDLNKVPLNWLDGKLPMPNFEEIILSNIYKKEESSMVHSYFYYPKREGSQFIVDRISKGLDIKVDYSVNKIAFEKGQILVNNNKNVAAIIYCGDVRNLHKIVKTSNHELEKALLSVSDLPSNGTSNVLCETDSSELSWLYLADNDIKAHRIIYTGNFSSTNSEGSKRSTCVVEFSGKVDKEIILKELYKLPGNLNAIAFNYEPNSYIIHNLETEKKILNLKSLLKPFNVHLLGRFAEWEYYNMDKCIEAAMELDKNYF